VAWVESESPSFSARYESDHTEDAVAVLAALEVLRDDLSGLYERVPDGISVVLHPRAAALAFSQPWLPLARRAAAPAARRYYAGWFSEFDIHVLAPPALEKRASGVPGSREALLLSHHEFQVRPGLFQAHCTLLECLQEVRPRGEQALPRVEPGIFRGAQFRHFSFQALHTVTRAGDQRWQIFPGLGLEELVERLFGSQ